MGMQGSFDASQFKPLNGFDKHPVGKFPFTISNTEIKGTKDGSGGMFVVEFTTSAGRMTNNYNIWNNSPKAVEIAHGQLSALCHATGVFRIEWANDGAALRNARGMIEVGFQRGEEPTAEKPEGGYVEVKKVFDANGNEPGRAPSNVQPQGVQPPGTSPSPLQQQPGGTWGGAQPQPQQQPTGVAPNAGGSGWSGASAAPQQNQQPQGGAAPGQAWQQGPGTAAPPWAKPQ